jgi:hypothetical protein
MKQNDDSYRSPSLAISWSFVSKKLSWPVCIEFAEVANLLLFSVDL